MKTKKYYTIDKSSWKDGPWKDEPDKIQWRDKFTGLPCLIVRNPYGALCGYVGVSSDHPWYGKDYSAVSHEVSVHGGLTFADKCRLDPEEEGKGICHVPEEGEPDNVWWFGFDCAHSYDLIPDSPFFIPGCTYRDVAYVKDQILGLAKELKQHERM
jgi:hypothetical protein